MQLALGLHTAWIAAACSTAFCQEPLRRAVDEGRKLTAGQVEVFEKQLQDSPFAVDTRARLIGYYFAEVQRLRQDAPAALRSARGRHVRWFIEHNPASDVLATGQAFAMSGWMHDPENYEVMRALWLQELERSPDRLEILKNATYLLQQQDRPLALSLMRRAYEITSHNDPSVTEYYGMQLGLLWIGIGNDGSATRQTVQAEIDASEDGRLLGSVGHTIVQYSNPGGEASTFARRLLHKAIALSPTDRIIVMWDRDLQRIETGLPVGHLRVSGGKQLAKLTHRVDLNLAGGAGTIVFVNAEIAASGEVTHTIAIAGPMEMQSAAAAAVKQWRFEPTLVNGKPVGVSTTFAVPMGVPYR